jgi:hypothetical protein
VQALGGAQFLELGVDDQGVDRLGDLDEGNLALEGDQGQAESRRGPDERPGQRPHEAPAEFDRQRAHPGPGQVRRVPRQQGRIGRQRDPGGQHELPALQQVRRVREFEDMNPANPGAKARRTCQHLRAAPPDDVKAEQVANGRKHNVK